MNSKDYFDQVASHWNKMRQSFFSDGVREKAYAVAGLQKEKVAADIGAGTGFITEGLLQRGLRVIAIDQSEMMINEIKKKFQGIDTIDYRIGEAENLPVWMKALIMRSPICFTPRKNPPAAIKEMVRILKHGGILVITDLDEHSFEFLKREHHDRWMGFKREDIERWFIEAGLKEVNVVCREKCCAQSSFGDEYASISIFVASGER
jgi:ubiquinone/menaquinone biosynthesis C-methylase UbiE